MRPIFAVGCASTAIKMLAGEAVLCSYAYWDTSFQPAAKVRELFSIAEFGVFDSGAFSVFNAERRGRVRPGQLSVETYAEFLCAQAPPHAWALTFDVIGDPVASARQHERLVKLVGDKSVIVPVFHEGAPLELLDHYVATSPRVALGRIAARNSQQKTIEFYNLVFNRQPDLDAHALGNSDPFTLSPFRNIGTFDASSWERQAGNTAKVPKLPWPFNQCSKETRMRAYIEANKAIGHEPKSAEFYGKTQLSLFG